MASPHPTTTSRVVVVTGGNRGIGRALCEHLLEKYTDIQVIMGSRSKANGMSAVEEICQQMGDTCNGRLDVVELDTSSDDSVQAAATEIAKKYSKLYGIVNNAGLGQDNVSKDIMNTNYFGPRRVNDALSGLL